MNSELNEQISALADGELEAEPARFLARRVGNDPALSETWACYHLIGNCLRGEACPPLDKNFAEAIWARIDEEAAVSTPRSAWLGRALRWTGGTAVAASVAVAALMMATPVPPVGVTTDGLQTVQVSHSEVKPTGLREQDLRPDLSRAAHTVSSTRRSQPLMPMWVANANGQSQLIYLPLQSGQNPPMFEKQPLSPLMPAALQPIQPPLRDAGSR
ncbi:MAG: sigma-E factor negative regulatory protein [Lysobacteraceae bacterium]